MTDNEDNDQTVACPICGDYEGEVSSVKSHITGSSGEHEGKSGGQYDELLRRRAGLLDEDDDEGNGDTAPDSESSESEESDGDADESGDTDDNDDADDTEDDVATPEEYQAQQERLNSDDEDDTDDEPAATEPVQTSGGGGLGGLVDNIPTKYLVVGLLMALVVAYLMLSGDDSDGDVVDVEAQEPDETEDDDTVETGVMMG